MAGAARRRAVTLPGDYPARRPPVSVAVTVTVKVTTVTGVNGLLVPVTASESGWASVRRADLEPLWRPPVTVPSWPGAALDSLRGHGFHCQ